MAKEQIMDYKWQPATLLGRQPMAVAAFGSMSLPQVVKLENGNSVIRHVDASTVVLPSVDVTDLKKCLDAGVDLKQVDSKVYGIRGDFEVSTDVSTEQKTEQSTEGDK